MIVVYSNCCTIADAEESPACGLPSPAAMPRSIHAKAIKNMRVLFGFFYFSLAFIVEH